jgi:hypothetical protein
MEVEIELSNSNLQSNRTQSEHIEITQEEIKTKQSSNIIIPQLQIYDTSSLYLIEKTEVVYLNMKNETKYHKILKLLSFSFAVISYSYLYLMLFQLAINRQNIYCFSAFSTQFELCSVETACKSAAISNPIMIYDNHSLSNISDINYEIMNVNIKYKDFYYDNVINLYAKITSDRLDRFTEFMDKFNGFVMLTEGEMVSLGIKYSDLCNYQTSVILFGMFYLLGSILGNTIMTLCSDILGRKKIFMISILICSISSILFFTLVFYVDSLIQDSKEDFVLNKKSYYSGNNNIEIIQQLYFSQTTRLIFKNYKIVMAFIFLFIHFSNTGAQHSMMCLVTENSINDNLVYKNFWMYNNAIIISIFYSYILVYPINDFKYAYLINSFFLLIIFILSFYYLKESPRQHYEYSEWIPYTKFFNTINHKNSGSGIKSLYVPLNIYEEISHSEKQAMENRLILVRQLLHSASKRKSTFEYVQLQLNQIKESVRKGHNLILTREEVRRNPFIIFTFLFYEKIIQNNNPIIWAFLVIVFFVFNIMNTNYYARYFFTREGLFQVYIVNSSFFYLVLVQLFSNFFFYIILQFFGFKRVMTFCFIGIMIFAVIVDFPLTVTPSYFGDLNKYNHNLIFSYFYDKFQKTLRISAYVLSFFQWGIYYTTHIYMFKYSRTIYRCTLFGMIDIINKIAFIGAELIAIYFGRNLLIAAIASFIGLFTIIFLTVNEQDQNIILDKKKFDNKKL